MLLSDVSIRRPVFATMLNLVLVVFGLFAMPRLPVDQMPDVDFPVVTVSVIYPGADPESVEQRILKPIEDAVNGISGIEKVMSTAMPNLGQVVIQFQLEKSSDQAAQETRDKVFAAVSELPTDAETPIVQKFEIGAAPILNIAVRSDKLPYAELSRIANDVILPTIERVPGVASVNTAGIREREVQVFADRERMAAFGITANDIATSIGQQNLDMPAGRIQNNSAYWGVRVKGRLSSGEDIGRLPVMGRPGQSLRISDVATVVDDIAEEKTAAFVGTTPTILMSVLKQSGTNTTAIAAQARNTIVKLQNQLPEGVIIDVVSDNSIYIKGSIDSVKLDLVIGAVLATIIVLVFLRNLRITVISAVTLPISVIATFAFINYMGFTLNMMTTLGLSLSIGILIDDAIIVIENVHRHLMMKKSGPQAAKDAVDEIGLAVLATTLTIAAVFVPVAFMEGIIGRFFYQFGLTVACAVMISLFVAFTATPMLSAKYLKDDDHHPKNPFLLRIWTIIENALNGLDNKYRQLLQWCLNHRKTALAAGFATFVLSFFMLKFVPVAFFPKEDKSQFAVSYTMPEGTPLELSKHKSLELAKAVMVYPGIDKVVTAVAATRDEKPNKSRLDVILVDTKERNFSQDELMARLREEVAPRFIGDGSEITISESNSGGGGRSEAIQYVFKSDDWASLVAFSDKVVDYIKQNIPGAVDVSSSKPKTQHEMRIELNADRAADLAVSAGQIATTVRSLYEGAKISEIEDRGSTFDVRMRISDKDRLTAEDLSGLSLTNRRGEQITLGSVAQIRQADAPSAIERFDGQRQIGVYANFTGKDLSAAASTIDAFVKQNMPSTVTMQPSGQLEIMQKAIVSMLKALLLAILLVFMILCAQYERYLAPMVIMAALPLSLTGAFGSLLLTGQVMSIYAMIGIILLMGLVTKNGILLIDFTLQRVNEGATIDQALLEAGPIRLRPILMTTFAAGGGMLPVAIGHGVGGEARSPMGVAVIGGLLMSTLLTLVIVPCLFSLVEEYREKLALRFKRKRAAKADSAAEAAHDAAAVTGKG